MNRWWDEYVERERFWIEGTGECCGSSGRGPFWFRLITTRGGLSIIFPVGDCGGVIRIDEEVHLEMEQRCLQAECLSVLVVRYRSGRS